MQIGFLENKQPFQKVQSHTLIALKVSQQIGIRIFTKSTQFLLNMTIY